MPHTSIQATDSQPAAEAGKITAQTEGQILQQPEFDWDNQTRQVVCTVSPKCLVALTRWTADHKIFGFAGFAVHLVRGDAENKVNNLFFIDPAEFGRAQREGREPSLLLAQFKPQLGPEDVGKYFELRNRRLAPLVMHDDRGAKRVTRLMETGTYEEGGFWGLSVFNQDHNDTRTVAHHKLGPLWQQYRTKSVLINTMNGPESLPLHPDAYAYALSTPTAWGCVRNLLSNLGYEQAGLMVDDGRNVVGGQYLARPERVINRPAITAAPATTLLGLLKTKTVV